MTVTPSGLLRRVLGRPGDRQRGFAEAGVAVTGAALVLGAALGSGVASTVVTMSDGVTWLPDDATGQVVQVNPGTGRAERRLQVAGPGSELEISQRDGRLVVTDGTTGTVTSIDLATLLAGGTRRSEEPARVLVGGGLVHLVTPGDGRVRAVDPLTLRDLGTPYDAGAPLADAVVDARGTVWLATTTGTLRAVTWLPDAERFDVGTIRRVRGGGAGTRLLPHARGVTVFAPDAGSVLQVGVGRDLTVAVPDLTGEVLPASTAPTDLAPAGVPGRSAVVMLAGDRVLDVAVGELGCARPGGPAVFADLVYVPCTGAGRVVVLRPDGSRARADVVLPAGRDPRLLVDDGRLVVHTEDGTRAVVVEADGRTRVIDTGRSRVTVHDPRDGGSGAVVAQPPPRAPAVPGATGQGGPGTAPGTPDAGPGGLRGLDGLPGGAPGDGDGPDASPGPSPAPTGPRPTGSVRPTPTATSRPPASPSDVEAGVGLPDDAGLSDVEVTWRAAADRPDTYVVRSSLTGVAPVEVDGGSTSATFRGLVCGVRGAFTVEAVAGSDRSAPASSPTVRTAACPAPPAAPTAVTATAHADGSVTVTWVPSRDLVDSYLVGPAGGSSTTTAATTTSVVLRDVPPGTDVRFAVRAVRARTTSAPALSPAVDVAGVPGSAAPLGTQLVRRLDREIGFVVRWTVPEANGSPLTRYVVTWSGDGIGGSTTPGAVTGCSAAQGCASGASRRTEVEVLVPCETPGLCVMGGPLTVTVTAENGAGAGPVASTVLDVPPASGRTTVIDGIEPVTPALDDPDVRMVVHLAPPQQFRDHPGTCRVDAEHSDGTRSSAAWSCQPGDVVIGPFAPGAVTVTARTVDTGATTGIGSMPSTVEVPPRSSWPSCDPAAGACAGTAGLPGDPSVTVVPVPWSVRLPAGPQRPPLAAAGAGLLLAAGALRALRLRRPDRSVAARPLPTPHVTTEETPA